MYWYYRTDRVKDRYAGLIHILEKKRETFCGIGTRKIKIRLNKLSDQSVNALLFRKALEIEDKNISAKKYPKNYRDKYYEEKSDLLDELIQFCAANNINVGYQEAEEQEYQALYVIYFDFPHCEQISWHTYEKPANCPKYSREWDGKTNSTLEKLEAAILTEFPDINR